MGERVRVCSFDDVKDAFRHRDLRQALYDDGEALMKHVIVNLHGDEHRVRRRVENRLFRRDVFRLWEHQLIPATIQELVEPHLQAGWAELQALARRTMLHVGLLVAGIDRPAGTEAESIRLAGLLMRLSRASAVGQSPLPKQEIIDDGQAALAELERDFIAPSAARRRPLVAAFARGDLPEQELPRDVLTTLLRYQHELELTWEQILKEVAYFPWVSAHSTANALAHTMEELFAWLEARPEDRTRAVADAVFLQQCVHETIRLHPASPEAWRHSLADITLRSGLRIPAGSFVVLDLMAANRDTAVFGPDAACFNPDRAIPAGVPPWGHSFGGGVHACIGQELAGGLQHVDGIDDREHLFGTIVVMVRTLLRNGAEPDPDREPTIDVASGRPHFATFPVRFTRPVPVN